MFLLLSESRYKRVMLTLAAQGYVENKIKEVKKVLSHTAEDSVLERGDFFLSGLIRVPGGNRRHLPQEEFEKGSICKGSDGVRGGRVPVVAGTRAATGTGGSHDREVASVGGS